MVAVEVVVLSVVIDPVFFSWTEPGISIAFVSLLLLDHSYLSLSPAKSLRRSLYPSLWFSCRSPSLPLISLVFLFSLPLAVWIWLSNSYSSNFKAFIFSAFIQIPDLTITTFLFFFSYYLTYFTYFQSLKSFSLGISCKSIAFITSLQLNFSN